MKTHEHDELSDTPEGKPQNRNQDKGADRGFERQDLSSPTLVKAMLFMVGFVPLCLLLLWVLMSTVWQAPERPPSPFDQSQVQAPEPRLQTSPVQDYVTLREQMARHLNTYGWVDQKANMVRVPIAVAKQRLLAQGLPERDQPPPPSRMPPAENGVRLDPQAATRWLEQGGAAARKDVDPVDALPSAAKAKNIPQRSPKEPLGETFPAKEGK